MCTTNVSEVSTCREFGRATQRPRLGCEERCGKWVTDIAWSAMFTGDRISFFADTRLWYSSMDASGMDVSSTWFGRETTASSGVKRSRAIAGAMLMSTGRYGEQGGV
jgi:hypothetical protein